MEKRQQFYQNKTTPKHSVPTKTMTSLQTCRSSDRKLNFNIGDGLAVTQLPGNNRCSTTAPETSLLASIPEYMRL